MFARLTDLLHESPDPMPWKTVAMMIVAMILPAVIAVPLIGRTGAVAFVAGMTACLSTQDAGLKVSLLVTMVLGMAGLLSLGAPEMALLIAPFLGLMAGVCGSFGLAKPAIRGLLTWPLFTSPIISGENLPLVFGVFVLAMFWAQGVTWAFGKSAANPEEDAESEPYAMVFGVALAVGITASVYVGQRYFGSHGFWFPLTFVILVLPPHGQLFSRTVKRTVGTILGTVVAVGVAWTIDSMWVSVALGVVCLPLGFRFLPRNYTLFTTLLTIAVLEVLALASDVDKLAVERVGTMGAAAAMTIALGLAGWAILKVVSPGALEALQEAGMKDDPPLEGQRRKDSHASASAYG